MANKNRIDDYLKNVFFLFIFDQHGNEKMIGTAFIIAHKVEHVQGYVARYFVTAKHVIENAKSFQDQYGLSREVYARFNTKSGRSKKYRLDIGGWVYDGNDTSVDIAIHPAGGLPDIVEYRALTSTMAVTKLMLTQREVAEGNEIFMVGLFSLHAGKLRNQPIVRTGNIAALPKERVKSNQFGSIEAHLIEARSMGGLSGSPVFVYIGTRGINKNFEVTEQNIRLFGVAQGHWEVYDGQQSINAGIGLVVPANKVIAIIKSPELKKERADAQERVSAKENLA